METHERRSTEVKYHKPMKEGQHKSRTKYVKYSGDGSQTKTKAWAVNNMNMREATWASKRAYFSARKAVMI